MKIGDLVSHTDIFGAEHVGVVTAGYMDLVEREGLETYDHKNLVEVYFNHGFDVLFVGDRAGWHNLVEVYFNHGLDVLFVEQLNVYSAVAQW